MQFGAKKLFKKKQMNEDMALQITSMADVFTIILVFLLKSYSTGALNVNPPKGMLLPEAHVGEASLEALKVEISESGVQVEGESVAALTGFRFQPTDLAANGSSPALSKVLERERQRQLIIAKANSDVKIDPKIVIVADQRVPYATVKTVLASAALNGYTDYKLAVIRSE